MATNHIAHLDRMAMLICVCSLFAIANTPAFGGQELTGQVKTTDGKPADCIISFGYIDNPEIPFTTAVLNESNFSVQLLRNMTDPKKVKTMIRRDTQTTDGGRFTLKGVDRKRDFFVFIEQKGISDFRYYRLIRPTDISPDLNITIPAPASLPPRHTVTLDLSIDGKSISDRKGHGLLTLYDPKGMRISSVMAPGSTPKHFSWPGQLPRQYTLCIATSHPEDQYSILYFKQALSIGESDDVKLNLNIRSDQLKRTQAADHWSISIETVKPTYVLGEPVVVQCTIQNSSDKPQRWLPYPSMREISVAQDGQQYQKWERPQSDLTGEFSGKRVVKILPGEKITHTDRVLVSGFTENNPSPKLLFPSAGKYRIRIDVGTQNYQMESADTIVTIEDPSPANQPAWAKYNDPNIFLDVQLENSLAHWAETGEQLLNEINANINGASETQRNRALKLADSIKKRLANINIEAVHAKKNEIMATWPESVYAKILAANKTTPPSVVEGGDHKPIDPEKIWQEVKGKLDKEGYNLARIIAKYQDEYQREYVDIENKLLLRVTGDAKPPLELEDFYRQTTKAYEQFIRKHGDQ